MSKSPDSERTYRFDLSMSTEAMARDLARERRVQSDEQPVDQELAADREFREQLFALRPPRLPPAMRQKAMAHASDRRSPVRWMALAATLIMSLIAVVAMQTSDDSSPIDAHQPTASDWAELQLALTALDASGRRVAQVTEREVRSHLGRADIQVTTFADSDAVWNWFPPSVRSIR